MNIRDEYVQRTIAHLPQHATWLDAEATLVIFDFGACEGLDSIPYSRAFRNAHRNQARISNAVRRPYGNR